jgi:hypothetical protein
METLQTNLRLVNALNEWDPLGYGEGSYEPEIADVVAVVHYEDSEIELAHKIQGIYEFSFEEIITLDKCIDIARELLMIKNEGTCAI